jgi:hypothetical protein
MVEKVHWTAADRDAVAAYMRHAENVPHYSAVELVAAWERSRKEGNDGIPHRYPTWSPQQVESIAKFSNSFFHSMDAIARGIARRITMDSPAELATFLSFIARYEWATTGHTRTVPEAERERYFLSILQAAAANDFAVAQRFAESALSAPAQRPSVKEYAPLTGAVLALLLHDEGELKKAVDAADRCKPKAYVAGMFETLRGAASRSPEQVAAGLNKVLKAYPKYMLSDPVMRLIDPHAHGLFRLCQRHSADLTSHFDIRRGPPWDPGLTAWWDADCEPLAELDLTAIDAEVHRVLIRLEQPVWWDAEESAAW